MKALGHTLLGMLIVLLLIGSGSGLYYSGTLARVFNNPMWGPQTISTSTSNTGTGGGSNPNTNPPAGCAIPGSNAILDLAISDALGSALTTSASKVDIIAPSLQSRFDEITASATYTVGSTPMSVGQEFYMMAFSTAGNTYYPEWYHLRAGWANCSPVYHLVPAWPPSGTTPWTEVQVGTMQWYPGNTNYWQIGPQTAIALYQRESGANTKFTIGSPSTLSVGTATGSSAEGGTPDSGTQSNIYAASASTFKFTLTVQLVDTKQVYGHPYLTLNTNYQWQVRYLVAWMSFNNSAINSPTITSSSPITIGNNAAPNWAACTVGNCNTAGYTTFYTVIPEIASTLTTTPVVTLYLQVDTGSLATGTKLNVRVWMADGQVMGTSFTGSPGIFDAASGISDAAPATLNPPVTGWGLSSTIYANGFQTASNKPSGQLIFAPFTSV